MIRACISFSFALVLISQSLCYGTYKLALCAIFQDEAPYLKEWIEFHKLQGVEHFYLYNNHSEDDFHAVLDPYIESKEVTLVNWPFKYPYNDHAKWLRIQSAAYMDCILSIQDDVEWLVVIDTDEFLFCTDGMKVPQFLANYTQYPGIAVNWIKFGTSGVWDIPQGYLMIELLTKSSQFHDQDNYFVKAIVQPKYVVDCISPHFFLYKDNAPAVDSNKRPITHKRKTRSKKILTDKIRINHYWSRTEKFFLEKKIASRQKRRSAFTTEKLLKHNESCNAQVNTAILQFVAPLREQMQLAPPVVRK